MATLRELTDQQFRDGTTIDGNRIDAALQGLVDAFNKLHPRHREAIWVQTQMVGGYSGTPNSVGTQLSPPWLDAFNASTATYTPQNPYRNKGCAVDGIIPVNGAFGSGKLWHYEVAFAVGTPVILQALQLWLHTDGSEYDNAFTAGATPPPGLANTEPLLDVAVTVLVDHPYDIENRRSTAAIVQKAKFRLDTVNANPSSAVPTGTMLPLMDGSVAEAPEGAAILLRGLNVPIPYDSRVRVIFSIPEYNTGSFDTTWGDDSWSRQYYSWAVTMHEPLEAL